MVTIKNISNRAVAIMLPHAKEAVSHNQTQRSGANGRSVTKRVTVAVATSITVDPGEIVTGLPDSMRDAPCVVAGLASRPPRFAIFDSPDAPVAAASEKKPKPARNKGK